MRISKYIVGAILLLILSGCKEFNYNRYEIITITVGRTEMPIRLDKKTGETHWLRLFDSPKTWEKIEEEVTLER